MRPFETGATRDTDEDKPDYEGFLSPEVLATFGRYMHRHRMQADGKLRDSDNWQRGIPADAYMKSAWRHFMDWWWAHRHGEDATDALCALLFNAMGYLHEELASGKGPDYERLMEEKLKKPAYVQGQDYERLMEENLRKRDNLGVGWAAPHESFPVPIMRASASCQDDRPSFSGSPRC